MSPDQPMSLPTLEVARVFPVPHELVFRAFSSAEHLKRWFHPSGYSAPEARVEFRVGGAFELCMCSPDGERHWTRGRFVEIFPHDRIELDLRVYGPDGRKRFRAYTIVRVRVEPAGTRVEVTQRYSEIESEALPMIDGAQLGWRETLDRLGDELDRLRAKVGGREVTHGSFTLERLYPVSPARVFTALTDPIAKSQWFGVGPDCTVLERQMEVRPGGRERLRVHWGSGVTSTFDALYFDVLPNERLVYAYEMHLDERKISVSLATLELTAREGGTRLVVTEQGAFLDDFKDGGSREQGTGALLDALGRALVSAAP